MNTHIPTFEFRLCQDEETSNEVIEQVQVQDSNYEQDGSILKMQFISNILQIFRPTNPKKIKDYELKKELVKQLIHTLVKKKQFHSERRQQISKQSKCIQKQPFSSYLDSTPKRMTEQSQKTSRQQDSYIKMLKQTASKRKFKKR